MHRDPVCGQKVNPNKSYVSVKYEGEVYYLCCPVRQREFERDPDRYIWLRAKLNRGKPWTR
jgi:YHS domain-containing protein